MRLICDLRSLTLDDYEQVIEQYTRTCADIAGVRAIFQFGNVSAPGLSDIDLMIVLDEDSPTTSDQLKRLSIKDPGWALEPRVAACFIHNVFVCSTSVFADIDWITPGNEWKRLAGSDVQRRIPDPEQRATILLVHGLDFAIAKLHELVRVPIAESCSIRWLIPQLWSLTHTRRALEAAGAVLEPSWRDAIAALTSIRSKPVDDVQPRDVAAALPIVVSHLAMAIDHFVKLLMTREGLHVNASARTCALASFTLRAVHVYHPLIGQKGRIRVSGSPLIRRLRLIGRTVESTWSRVDLPSVVLAHHLAYLAAQPMHVRSARRLAQRGRVPLGDCGSNAYQLTICKRATLVQKNNQFLRAHQVAFSHLAIPGLLVKSPVQGPQSGTWRHRALKSLLDWKLLPPRTLVIGS